MEAGGDSAAPAPGAADGLEDLPFPSEETGDSGAIHTGPQDPGDDGDLEETGVPSPRWGLGRTPKGLSLLGKGKGGSFGDQ